MAAQERNLMIHL